MPETSPLVLVLMGGPDAEREVSLLSGRAVAQALRDGGRCRVAEQVVDRPSGAELATLAADVVFPVLHGPWGEGGPLQEMLDAIGVPYVGSGPRAAALAMDKLGTKRCLAEAGVLTPPAARLEPGDACPLDPPIVLKPIDDGSSVDLHICRTAAEIDAARTTLHARRGAIMAETYQPGREVTVGVVCGEALPPLEITPAAEFYDYDAKYVRRDTRYTLDPALPGDLGAQCTQAALLGFERLGCRDLARVDFIVNEGGAWFLEINTMPGFTSHSLVPMAAASRGLDMPALCTKLVETALARASSTLAGARLR